MSLAVILTTDEAEETAAIIAKAFPDASVFRNGETGGLAKLIAEIFTRYEGLVFVMAAGIVVRVIAAHITDKHHDPAVVVIDDARRFAISLLSGHEGGANNLAYKVAAATGAVPVVTTATETLKRHTLGLGCRRGVNAGEVVSAVQSVCSTASISIDDIRVAGTIDCKSTETGLTEAFSALRIPLRFFPRWEINAFRGNCGGSPAAQKNLGVWAVAEPCALILGRNSRILIPKTILGRVTVALAAESL